jgi:acyl carrier protein
MITVAEISDLVKAKLHNRLPHGISDLTEDTDLQDLGLSSLQISDIVFTLEERHGFEFDAARAADTRTIGEIAALANETLANV